MSFVNQSQSVVMQNQSKRAITFDTQLKTALIITLFLWIVKPTMSALRRTSHLWDFSETEAFFFFLSI